MGNDIEMQSLAMFSEKKLRLKISNDMYSGEMYSGDMDHNNNTIDKCTGDYMSISAEYCGEWVGAKIVKLPMWGAQEEDSDNYFEYPSSEEFAGMQPDVQLKSI